MEKHVYPVSLENVKYVIMIMHLSKENPVCSDFFGAFCSLQCMKV